MTIFLIILATWLFGTIVALRPVGKAYMNRPLLTACPKKFTERYCKDEHSHAGRWSPPSRDGFTAMAILLRSFIWPFKLFIVALTAMIPESDVERAIKETNRRLAEDAAREAMEEEDKARDAELAKVSKELDWAIHVAHHGEDTVNKQIYEKAQQLSKHTIDKLKERNEELEKDNRRLRDELYPVNDVVDTYTPTYHRKRLPAYKDKY